MANKFKAAREAAGLTQAAMAERMEIPLRTIQDWERGKRTPPLYVERFVLRELKELEGTVNNVGRLEYNFAELTNDEKVAGRVEWPANYDDGYYCTNCYGEGIFWVGDGDRQQKAAPADWDLKGLTKKSAQVKIKRWMAK